MTKFKRGRDNGYTLITPASPLLQLEEFLEDHLFALGTLRARFHHIHLETDLVYSHRFIKKVCAGACYTARLGQLCHKAWWWFLGSSR